MKSVFLICIASILFWGCSPNKHDKKIFRYNEFTGIASLDPAFAKNQSIMWATHQLYNKLIETDDSLRLKPSLAKKVEIVNNGLQYRFTIRDSVYFHNDACFNNKPRKLVAEDFVYSLNRIIDKEVASPGAWIFNNCIDTLKPFEAPNDSTFIINLRKPYQPLLGILSMEYCCVLPKEAVSYYGKNFRAHPVGTGPFKFVAWEEGQALVLTKNENYFETDEQGNKLPYLDGIKVSFLESKATEFLAFRQGKLDFINDIDASFKDEVITKTGKLKPNWTDKVYMNKSPYLNIEYLGMVMDDKLQTNAIFKNINFRKALNYGFDRQKMILYLRNSIGTAANSGFAPAGLPSFDSIKVKGYHYNPRLAKEYLQKANYKGEEIKLITIPNYQELASSVVNELKQIGINARVETEQKATLLDKTKKGQIPFFRGSWIADYPDAENFYSVFYSKNPAPPNYTRFKNEEYDKLYEAALNELNIDTKFSLFHKMDQIIIEQAPIVPLWYDMVIHLVHNNISNFKANGFNMLELRRVKKN